MQKMWDYFFEKLLDKILMFIFVSICTIVGKYFIKLTESIIELNTTMKVVVVDTKSNKDDINTLTPRVDILEKDVLILKTKRNHAQEE